jgi:hypothetical protein
MGLIMALEHNWRYFTNMCRSSCPCVTGVRFELTHHRPHRHATNLIVMKTTSGKAEFHFRRSIRSWRCLEKKEDEHFCYQNPSLLTSVRAHICRAAIAGTSDWITHPISSTIDPFSPQNVVTNLRIQRNHTTPNSVSRLCAQQGIGTSGVMQRRLAHGSRSPSRNHLKTVPQGETIIHSVNATSRSPSTMAGRNHGFSRRLCVHAQATKTTRQAMRAVGPRNSDRRSDGQRPSLPARRHLRRPLLPRIHLPGSLGS